MEQEIRDCNPDFKNAPVSTDSPELAAHVDAIRQLGKQTIGSVIEIGRRLTKCKDIVGHGNWLPWLNRKFGWTEMTATRFINVYDMSKSNNLLDFDLPISGLYLLAAPSTPEPAREEIIGRATNGEKLTVNDVKATRSRHVNIFREMKLGEEAFEKIRNTSLDRADEKDELILLNRGAPQGALTPIVKKLIEDASAGKDVSALELQAKFNKPTKRAMARIAAREAQARALQDVGPHSAGEVARLQVRNAELENQKRRLESENIGLKSEVEELKAGTTTPADLSPRRLQAEIEKLGLLRFRQEILPGPWVPSLTNYALSLATTEKLIETLERKIPSANKTARKCFRELKKAINQPTTTITETHKEIRAEECGEWRTA